MTAGSLDALFAEADRQARAGRRDAAELMLRRILDQQPGNPRALNALGNHALNRGDAAGAMALFRQAIAADPVAAPIWLNLALAACAAGDAAGEIEALDGALAADPYFMVALLHKAQWLERHDRADEAARAYQNLLDAAPPHDQLTPAFRAALEHGRTVVVARKARTDAAIRAAIGDADAGSDRFRHALDVLAGRRQIYQSKPAGLHFPYLPAVQFFDRALFPWFAELEAATGRITAELGALIRSGVANVPYVQVAAGQPVNQWATLNNSLAWGALFLWKNGVADARNCALCPETSALLRTLPLLDVPGRSPTVMFSTLQPGAHIPPHEGVTNTRVVIHLPLIVPEGARFRVGSETRPWRVGEAWAFDDTIEHEAWNDSDSTRVILIIDAWNPYLTSKERDLLRTTIQVLQRSDVSETPND